MLVLDLNEGTGTRATRIADAIARAIAAGELPPGAKLPTHRELARQLGVSIGTITRAYAEAERRRLVHGEVGRGTFVRHVVDDPLAAIRGTLGFAPVPRTAIDMTMNYAVPCPAVDDAMFSQTMCELADDPRGSRLLTDAWLAVQSCHREAGAAWLRRAGLEVDPARVLIGGGFHPSLIATLRTVCEPGDIVLTESLSYPGFTRIAQTCGVRLHPVAIDEQGLVPDELERARRSTRARVLYCRPTYHSATTATMDAARRRAIADFAETNDLTIIEDDEMFPFAVEPHPPLAQLAPTRTIFIADVGRALMMGVRLSYVLAPPTLHESLAEALIDTTWMLSPLIAELATRWIESDRAEQLLQAKRDELAARYDIIMQSLGPWGVRADSGCHHAWLPLPETWRPDAFVAAAASEDVGVLSAEAFVIGRTPAPRAVRLCPGSLRDRDQVEQGCRCLRDLLDGAKRRRRVVM